MKKYYLYLILLLIGILAIGCDKKKNDNLGEEIARISIQNLTDHAYVGESLNLHKANLKITYKNLKTKIVTRVATWKATDKSKITIKNGIATAIAEGKVELIATFKGKKSIQDLEIFSTESKGKINNLDFNSALTQISLGHCLPLSKMHIKAILANGYQESVDPQNITWISDSPKLIIENGIAEAKETGLVYITAFFGGQQVSKELEIVKNNPKVTVTHTFRLMPDNKLLSKIQIYHSLQLRYQQDYNDGTYIAEDSRAINWKTSDPNKISIDDHGLIRALKITKDNNPVTIEANLYEKKASKIMLSVTRKKTGMILKSIKIKPTTDAPMSVIMKGGTKQLQVIGTYNDNTTNDITTKVSWVTENDKIVKVGKIGLLEAKGELETSANITAYLKNERHLTLSAQIKHVKIKKNVIASIVASNGAFAALRENDTVVTWGHMVDPYDFRKLTDVKKVFANYYAFAALKNDRSVSAWGDADNGGDTNNRNFYKVNNIYPSPFAFATLDIHKKVNAWGDEDVSNISFNTSLKLDDIKSIYHTIWAYAALTNQGKVVVWGKNESGGRSNDVANLTDVKAIFSTDDAFAALKKDDTVYVWGNQMNGGNQDDVKNLKNVKTIVSTAGAFAALTKDGKVTVWGNKVEGGDPQKVASLDNVKTIFATKSYFVALKQDNSITVWGEFSDVKRKIEIKYPPNLKRYIIKTVQDYNSTKASAFIGQNQDDSLVVWGYRTDSKSPANLRSIHDIYANNRALAALHNDGSVTVWGSSSYGGSQKDVEKNDVYDVKKIYVSEGAFAALRYDGSVVTWGRDFIGGDSSNVRCELENNIGREHCKN